MQLTIPSLTEFCSTISRSGHTDTSYLSYHYARYTSTLERFASGWSEERGLRVLDVGAHWLHQSLLWRMSGFEVTAADLPPTFELDDVRSLAAEHSIKLVQYDSLENPVALEALPENSFDVMLFTEILEHLTFNPVRFWRAIHRVLAPGARIVLTTPNYYAYGSRCWSPWRFLTGFGGGIDVFDVIRLNTTAHHWKEFSRRETIKYFCILSTDFDCVKSEYVDSGRPIGDDERRKAKLRRWITRVVPWLHDNLYFEIELRDKNAGIVIQPTW